jgi:hypothetical protein
MATLFALITGFPFELGEIFVAIFVSFEPIRELQKVLSFKYIHFKLLFDYKYMHLNCDLYHSFQSHSATLGGSQRSSLAKKTGACLIESS